jgi:hypothetical protein
VILFNVKQLTPSFRRTPESIADTSWTPAFAGVTVLSLALRAAHDR